MNLETRKRLARPVYALGWWLIHLAGRIDGPQPRKPKDSPL